MARGKDTSDERQYQFEFPSRTFQARIRCESMSKVVRDLQFAYVRGDLSTLALKPMEVD